MRANKFKIISVFAALILIAVCGAVLINKMSLPLAGAADATQLQQESPEQPPKLTYIKLGDAYSIPSADIYTVRVTDPKGHLVKAEDSFDAIIAGEYLVEYLLEGQRTFCTSVISYSAMPEITIDDTNVPVFLYYGQANAVPALSAVTERGQFPGEVIVTAPDGTILLPDYIPHTDGEYTIDYTFIIGDILIEKSYTAEVAFSKAGVFSNVRGINSINANCDFPSGYAVSGNGVEIIGQNDGSGVIVSYNHVLDLNIFSKDDNLLTVMPLSGGDYAGINEMIFRMIDRHDPDNVMSLKFSRAANVHSSYALASVDGRYLGIDATGNTVYNGKYGTVLSNISLAGSAFSNISPFTFSFDNQEKQIFIVSSGTRRNVLDFDNPRHMGAGKEWGGFTTGEVYLEIELIFDSFKPGGIIVSEIAGQCISSDFAHDGNTSVPYININTLSEYQLNMPKGAVGVPYAIPKVTVSDWYFGQIEPEVRILAAGTDVTGETMADGFFTAKQTGRHVIEYSVTNLFGHKTVNTLDVTVIGNIPPIVAILDGQDDYPQYKRTFVVPQVLAAGGSGFLDLYEELEYNGAVFELPESRKVFIDALTPLKLNVHITGYTGETVTKTFILTFDSIVQIAPDQVFTTVIKGKQFIVPDFDAVNSLGAQVTKKYFLDGEEVEKGQYITVRKNAGEQYILEFKAYSGSETKTETFIIDIINPDQPAEYFMHGQEVTSEIGSRGMTLTTESSGNVIKYAMPMTASGFVFRAAINSSENMFNYLDVRFEDFYDTSKKIFLRFTPVDEKSVYVQVNGRGERAIMDGSFSDSTRFIHLIFDSYNGRFLNNLDEVVVSTDFTSVRAVNLSFEMGEVYGKASITINQLSNQNFVENSFLNGDRRPPAIAADERTASSNKVNYKSQFYVPSVTVFDVLDNITTTTVSVTAPSGEKLPGGSTDGFYLTAEEYGIYTVTFTATDTSGRSERFVIRYKVVDTVSPDVTVTANVKSSYNCGESFEVPQISATDNFDADVSIQIVLHDHTSYKMIPVKAGERFVFTQSGNYTLILRAYDSSFNITEMTYDIKVN